MDIISNSYFIIPKHQKMMLVMASIGHKRVCYGPTKF